MTKLHLEAASVRASEELRQILAIRGVWVPDEAYIYAPVRVLEAVVAEVRELRRRCEQQL